MILTEHEAATKRCQEGFGPPLSDVPMMMAGAAGIAIMTSPTCCIGSRCMAWRWFDNLDDDAIKTPRGFCGKAGQP